MSMYAKIRRMHFREKLSISEIARRTSLSRNTIKKWLKQPERDQLTYTRASGRTKLDAFAATLKQMLRTDAHRPKRDRRTVLNLFAELRSQGYRGSYARLTVRIPAKPGQHSGGCRATVPVHAGPVS